jgi:protein phosphatase
MRLTIPDFSLVLMMGASGSGKSTFAARQFVPTEILSSDRCRGMVADDESDQAATGDAFDVLYYIAGKRLAARRLTVIDATNLRAEDRKHAIELARRYHALPVVIALDVPEAVCAERNRARPDRAFGAHVVRNHVQLLRRSLRGLQREGFRVVHVLSSPEDIAGTEIAREPLFTDRRTDHGPFDIIGDVHGCHNELTALLTRLGYTQSDDAWSHLEGRRVIFLGDLVDRGPDSPGVLRLVMNMVASGTALCVQGNHDNKLERKLAGRDVKVNHGMAETLAQFDALPNEQRTGFLREVRAFLDGLRSHYWLDGGKLVVAHAGLKAEMHGRGSGAVRSFALYGETTGETDEFGLPVRYEWARDYRGEAMVVYGHTPVPEPEWINRTLCIDTGCVFGGSLTALRYPERELVSVSAKHTYAEPVRPLAVVATTEAYDLLDIEDVSGKRIITTRLMPSITVREENAAAGIEVMSRFCVDPRWLIYLPPTMSPSETSSREGLLEHPDEAFAHYRRAGVERVVIEEKHMGSRAVVVICRDPEAAAARFRVPATRRGVIYTRTGRPFFSDLATETALLDRLGAAMDASGFWDRFATGWACLDAELMPWSAKARALIDEQYAPVGAAAVGGLNAAVQVLAAARSRHVATGNVEERFEARRDAAIQYDAAWRRYTWEVHGLEDLKLAPFHLLATEGAVHDDKDHAWHMRMLAEVCARDPGVLLATTWHEVPLADEQSVADAVAWWTRLTADGGEGMVVKPAAFVTRGSKGLVQPALKVRGREYLRLIYGPEYTLPGKLERLRERGLSGKRGLALREFALGLEALHRFVMNEPLRRIHECAFGVLALESEPVDPRL